MNDIWINTIISTLLVCIASFAGVLFLAFKMQLLKKIVFVLVSFAVGALFGNAFFMLIPEAKELLRKTTNTTTVRNMSTAKNVAMNIFIKKNGKYDLY